MIRKEIHIPVGPGVTLDWVKSNPEAFQVFTEAGLDWVDHNEAYKVFRMLRGANDPRVQYEQALTELVGEETKQKLFEIYQKEFSQI